MSITHFHPLFTENSEKPFNDHDHTKKEIQFFASLNFELYDTTDLLFIEAELLDLKSKFNTPFAEQLNYFSPVSKITLRGPPEKKG